MKMKKINVKHGGNMEKFKSERGSATVVTLTVVLFFTIILMGVYVSANNANRAQKNADTTIIDKYGEDVNYINEIYNSLFTL